MSFERVFIFTCNICGAAKSTPNYGAPAGFKFYYHNQSREIHHACPACVKILVDKHCAKIEDKQLALLSKQFVPSKESLETLLNS